MISVIQSKLPVGWILLFYSLESFGNRSFLRQTKPAPFWEEATIFTIAEKAKTNPSFTPSAQYRIVYQARRKSPFYIRTEAKRTPHIWGPCKHPDRRSTMIPQRIIRRKRPFFAGLCSGWRTRLWEAKDLFRSSDPHK